MGDAVLLGDLLGFGEFTPHQGNHFNASDVFDAVQMLGAKGTRTGQGYFDGHIDSK